MELHEVFERVSGKVPEVRGYLKHDGSGWWLDRGSIYVADEEAETLIVGACVRLLPGRFWHEDDGQFVVCRQDGGVLHVESGGDSLAIAMLLAVEASVKTPGPMPAPACECSSNPAVTDCLRVGCGRTKK